MQNRYFAHHRYMFQLPQHSHHQAVHRIIGKADPLQAWSGPEGSRNLRFSDYTTKAPATAPAAFTPGNTPGTHFC